MAKKVAEKSTLVVATTTPVLEFIDEVKKEKAELKAIQESVYKTSGKIGGWDGNIQTETSIQNLLKGFGIAVARYNNYQAAQQFLKWDTVPVFKLDGYSLEEFAHDVNLRKQVLETKERFDELNEIEKGFTDLMDKEEKAALLYQKLEKFRAKSGK